MRHSAHSGHIDDHTRLLPKPRAHRDGAATHFHRFSMAAWMIQLIPYFMGMLTGIPMIDLSANEAFYPALIGASMIGLTLYLHGNARWTQSNKLFIDDALQNTDESERTITNSRERTPPKNDRKSALHIKAKTPHIMNKVTTRIPWTQ